MFDTILLLSDCTKYKVGDNGQNGRGHRLKTTMNNIDSHRRYFRSMWKEKNASDQPESTPLFHEEKQVPKNKKSKLYKGLRRFRRQFIRELKIICSPSQQREIRRKLKEQKKAEKMKRLVLF